MSYTFTKMQALGNDFVVFDAVRQSIPVTPEWIRQIADRHWGVGCDQVLLVTPTDHPQADFGYRIFNADGIEVNQCGNGARCVGLFIQEKNLSAKKTVNLATRNNVIQVMCLPDRSVQVDIAIPDFHPDSLPFVSAEKAALYPLQLDNHAIAFDVVSVGNPHCIICVDKIEIESVVDIGAQLNAHSAFPEGVNVGFMQVISPDEIRLCVYERGVGLTQACGSGACAAVAVGRRAGYLNSCVVVKQAGGELRVQWESPEKMIRLTGTASIVFEGVM